MADDKGKGDYGTVHVMEEEMRAAGQGVFEPRSSEKRAARKAAAPTATKDAGAAPSNKSAGKK